MVLEDSHQYLKQNFFSIELLILFVWFIVLRPNQQLWSRWHIASILWDFYPTFGCHDLRNVLLNITTKGNDCMHSLT